MLSSCKKLVAQAMSIVAMCALGTEAFAAKGRQPIVVYKGTKLGDPTALRTQARNQGKIRVIIGLNMAMSHEDRMPEAARQMQARSLRNLQDRVLAPARLATESHVLRFETIPYMSAWVTPAELDRIFAQPEVVSVQEDVPRLPTLSNSVPLIKADQVWAKGFNGTGMVVAVLDTGVDLNHAMLDGEVVSGACYSTNLAPNVSSLCPGGVTERLGLAAGRNCNLALSGCDHGTHVASIAAGFSSTSSGVAYKAKILSIQVFSRSNSDTDCGGPGTSPCAVSYSSDQVKALERVYALRNTYQFAAVNMSLGGGSFNATCDASEAALAAAIGKLRDAKIATVIASGNDGFDGSISSPGCISTAITVGSSTKTDEISSFSNHATLVDILAPGSDIAAAQAGTLNGSISMSGTSMATPHAAGAFALLRDIDPRYTVNDMARALICTGTLLRRSGNTTYRPRISVLNAWRMLKQGTLPTLAWNFSALSQSAEWQPLLGSWTVSADNYQISSFEPNSFWNMSFVPSCRDRFTLTARMKRIDTVPTRTLHWNSGIMVRAKYDNATKVVSGYWFGYNSFDSSTSTPGNGQALVQRFDNKALLGTGGTTQLCKKDNANVIVGGYNTLKVVANESVYDFYLNNQLICTVRDTMYVTGAIGVSAAVPKPFEGTHDLKVDQVTYTQTATPTVAATTAFAVHPAQFAPQELPPGETAEGVAVASRR